MGRGENIATDDLFYGEVGSEDGLSLRAQDFLREGDLPKFFELLRSYPELRGSQGIVEEASRVISQSRAHSLFGNKAFSDWPVVSGHLAREAQGRMMQGDPPVDAFDFSFDDLLVSALNSSGPMGDAAREYISASHLDQMTARISSFAVSSTDANKQALLHPLARAAVSKLLAQSGGPQHSVFAGFVSGEEAVLHLGDQKESTRSLCGKSGYGYASAPYGAWRDADGTKGPSRCPRCLQSAPSSLEESAREESSLDGGDFVPWREDEIFEIVQEVGLPSISEKLGSDDSGYWENNWHLCRDALAEEMTQGLVEKSL